MDFSAVVDGQSVSLNVSRILASVTSGSKVLSQKGVTQEERRKTQTANYRIVKKDVSKYHSIIDAELKAAPGETVIYGEHTTQVAPTEILSSDIARPVNAVESKILNMISGLKKNRREKAQMLFPKATGHSEVEAARAVRQIRELVAQETRESTRLKSIKAKSNRKSQRKQEARLMEKLAIEDPAAAEKLREEFEIKRAEARMLLGTKARREWAKMAKRFGGKDLERSIQSANMDAQQMKEYLDRMSGKTAGDDSSDDEKKEDTAEAEDEDKGGIWAMPFMKRARELKETERKLGIDTNDDFETGLNHIADEDDQAKAFLEKKRRGEPTEATNDDEGTRDEKPDSTASADDDDKEAEDVKDDESDDSFDLMKFVVKPKKEPVRPVAEPEAETNKDEIYNAKFFRTGKVNGVDIEQESLVRMAFSSKDQTDEAEFARRVEEEEMKVIEDALEAKQPSILPGWGNWCAENYEDKRVTAQKKERAEKERAEKQAKLAELKKTGHVKVNPTACKPNDKYIVSKLPYQFKNARHYSAVMRKGISDQFVTVSESRIATAAKHEVIKGRVISALKPDRRARRD